MFQTYLKTFTAPMTAPYPRHLEGTRYTFELHTSWLADKISQYQEFHARQIKAELQSSITVDGRIHGELLKAGVSQETAQMLACIREAL